MQLAESHAQSIAESFRLQQCVIAEAAAHGISVEWIDREPHSCCRFVVWSTVVRDGVSLDEACALFEVTRERR